MYKVLSFREDFISSAKFKTRFPKHNPIFYYSRTSSFNFTYNNDDTK